MASSDLHCISMFLLYHLMCSIALLAGHVSARWACCSRETAAPPHGSKLAAEILRTGHDMDKNAHDSCNHDLLQASSSGKQHYLRAVFSTAGCYALAVTVTDPVTSEAVPIPAHSASEQLIILPGPLAAERTQISDMPSTLTAGGALVKS